MDMKEFAEKVQERVHERLRRECRVELLNVTKNNHVELLGLHIYGEHQNVSPTIYLNTFFEAYQAGMTMSRIVERIVEVYEQGRPGCNVDMSFFKEYALVKDRICAKLINREKNRELLEQIPHVEFLDLAICFYYAYNGKELGAGSILIYHSHAVLWDVGTEALLAAAAENTPALFAADCVPMNEMILGLLNKNNPDVIDPNLLPESPMMILTNRERVQGAITMLYPELLKSISDRVGSDLFILPSSVHEVILLPDDGQISAGRLKEMILEVNTTQLDPEDVLSDNLYYFNRESADISVL